MSAVAQELPPAELVAAFWGALYARDWARIGAFFGDGSLYWDVPVGPAFAARGPDGIVGRLRTALDGLPGFEDDPIRTVAQGDTVITEHNEVWRWASGESVTLPITSVQVAYLPRFTWLNGTPLSAAYSRGIPRSRSLMMFLAISVLPPPSEPP